MLAIIIIPQHHTNHAYVKNNGGYCCLCYICSRAQYCTLHLIEFISSKPESGLTEIIFSFLLKNLTVENFVQKNLGLSNGIGRLGFCWSLTKPVTPSD